MIKGKKKKKKSKIIPTYPNFFGMKTQTQIFFFDLNSFKINLMVISTSND